MSKADELRSFLQAFKDATGTHVIASAGFAKVLRDHGITEGYGVSVPMPKPLSVYAD